MKVLVLTQYFWPESFGINGIVQDLRDRKAELTVLTGKPNYPDGTVFPGYKATGTQSETYAAIEVLRVPIAPRGKRSGLRLALNYLSFITSAAIFGPRLLKGRSLDVVFVYAPSPLLQAIPAALIARSRGIPLVVWVQDLWPESLAATGYARNPWLLRLVEHAVRWIYRRTDMILVQSEAFRLPVARLTDNPGKIRFYPNTIPGPGDQRTGTESGRQLADQLRARFSIVFAGNLGQAQALETVLDAADMLRDQPEIQIVLIGSGSADAMLKAEVERRNLTNVVLPGRLPPQDMPVVFAAASALLVTLRAEPIFALTVPSKVQAYLAAGRPILAALDGEGARIVTEAGAGLTCPAEDAAGLAGLVRALAAMPEPDRERMGSRGKAYFQAHFDPERLADELMGHLTDAVAQRRGVAT